MKTKWAVLLTIFFMAVGATAQNATNSSFQIKGILLDSLTQGGGAYATIRGVKKKGAGHNRERKGTEREGKRGGRGGGKKRGGRSSSASFFFYTPAPEDQATGIFLFTFLEPIKA